VPDLQVAQKFTVTSTSCVSGQMVFIHPDTAQISELYLSMAANKLLPIISSIKDTVVRVSCTTEAPLLCFARSKLR
jgi:hypothetical protein